MLFALLAGSAYAQSESDVVEACIAGDQGQSVVEYLSAKDTLGNAGVVELVVALASRADSAPASRERLAKCILATLAFIEDEAQKARIASIASTVVTDTGFSTASLIGTDRASSE